MNVPAVGLIKDDLILTYLTLLYVNGVPFDTWGVSLCFKSEFKE